MPCTNGEKQGGVPNATATPLKVPLALVQIPGAWRLSPVSGLPSSLHLGMYSIWPWIKTPCCRGPPSVASLCHGRLFQTLCRGCLLAIIKYYLKVALCFWGFVAEGFVAEHPSLLQTYFAKWPPEPVANPMLLIHCHTWRDDLGN